MALISSLAGCIICETCMYGCIGVFMILKWYWLYKVYMFIVFSPLSLSLSLSLSLFFNPKIIIH